MSSPRGNRGQGGGRGNRGRRGSFQSAGSERGGPPAGSAFGRGGEGGDGEFRGGREGRGGSRGGDFRDGGPPASFGPAGGSADQPAATENRPLKNDQDELVAKFETNSLADPPGFPTRPDWGTKGTAIKLRTNYFPIEFTDETLYNYDIEIEPKVIAKRIQRRIFQLVEASPSFEPFKDHIAHDSSKRLISSKQLPITGDVLKIKIKYYDENQYGPNDKSKEYSVRLTLTGSLDPKELKK